ncbi:hypothetical protein RIF29_32436 [Crotalaria pallida]|uniref:Dirigent protein n=1 Tax=Crotalaria pallida TaxID=3830 RepID=A0AAN9I2F7_CROPI
MSKQSVVVMIVILIVSVIAAGTQSLKLKAENWGASFEVEAKKETITNLQFYFHDTLSGKNPSAVQVAQPIDKNKSFPTLFGEIMMVDDPLTETPDPNSKLLGRAQGLYGSSCQQELGLLMAISYSFIEGPYSGSSFTVLGKNAAMNPVREMPIVGGTGLFRLARGYALAKTYWLDPTTGDAIVGYNVTLLH